MASGYHKTQRGFSLVEMAIVLAVSGVLIAGIWTYAESARQAGRVEQAVEAVATGADAVRIAYQGRSSISGGVWTVEPILVQTGALPSNLIRSASSTCNGITGNYADTPWGGVDACGTLRFCAWNYAAGGNRACGTPTNPASVQYFAIEFTQLDYGSCLALAERVAPTNPNGLLDVFINNSSAVYTGNANAGLPVAPNVASGLCAHAALPANTVDFVYSLRTPSL